MNMRRFTHRTLSLTTYSIFALAILRPPAFAETLTPGGPVWNLPVTVNDSNTHVKFDVDTTWHVVHGKVPNISGNISLSDPTNPFSVQSEIRFPVMSFDTGWSMRDESLQDSMAAKDFPDVVFRSTGTEGSCSLDEINSGKPCNTLLVGTLTIRDITRDAKIPVTISKNGANYEVSGAFTFRWDAFKVKDPSIMMAKVDPDVKVTYTVTIPGK